MDKKLEAGLWRTSKKYSILKNQMKMSLLEEIINKLD